jgi:hypothetical protein
VRRTAAVIGATSGTGRRRMVAVDTTTRTERRLVATIIGANLMNLKLQGGEKRAGEIGSFRCKTWQGTSGQNLQ